MTETGSKVDIFNVGSIILTNECDRKRPWTSERMLRSNYLIKLHHTLCQTVAVKYPSRTGTYSGSCFFFELNDDISVFRASSRAVTYVCWKLIRPSFARQSLQGRPPKWRNPIACDLHRA